MAKLTDRFKNMWNAFNFQEKHYEEVYEATSSGPVTTQRPDRNRSRFAFNEKTIINAIYTRMAIDAASVPIKHVRLDSNDQYSDDMVSGLNDCLTVEANCDQAARQFRQDVVATMFEEGVVAMVPINLTDNPFNTGSFDVLSMRAGKIMSWKPRYIQVRVYDDRDEPGSGIQKDIWVAKDSVAIVENPFYTVMNEPSGTLQRLLRKLSLLDVVDEQSASGKLDLIIQLPYAIKTESKRNIAETRRKDIEFQLKDSQYGIAYVDGTEKVTQLNRPAENNLMDQVTYLTTMLYGQLGLTEDVMNGTASPDAMLDYFNRTIEPILAAMTEAMIRSFLTKTARSQGQSIIYLIDPFRFISINNIAEVADKLTRNEILSSNEFRAIIGKKPSKDPKADQLLNKNLPIAYDEPPENGKALTRPALPQKSPFPQVRAIPEPLNGVNSQNGTGP